MTAGTVYGGIEAGGTKMVCAIGTGPDDVRAEVRFPTTNPDETLARIIAFFQEQHAQTPLASIGIGAFGPVDPNPSSSTYGYITSTPKLAWLNTDVAGPIGKTLGVPIGFDTDVNVAAMGEYRWGAAQGLSSFVYITVGTGIGGGGLVNGQRIHGLIHPEMGHMYVPHDRAVDPFAGNCPYHGDCLEGLANGPAIERRWGQRGETLPVDHPAWALEAEYLAYAIVNCVTILSPQRIVIGGGVMAQPSIYPMMRQRVLELLNNYVQSPAILEQIDTFIVPPQLGSRSGVLGAIALAEEVAKK